jgi:hypothetical protein
MKIIWETTGANEEKDQKEVQMELRFRSVPNYVLDIKD